MQPSDRERFAALIADVLAFYGQTPSHFALDVWWQACQPYEFERVQRALGRHAVDPERGVFAPKPADLVRQVAGTPTDRAARAWSLALDAASKVGAYTDVAFDDPIIHAVIEDLGGWIALCRTSAEQLSYLQHRFTEGYRAYVHRGDLQQWPAKLRGDRSPDEAYLLRGLARPAPALIGDPERAMRVMAGGAAESKRITFAAEVAERAIAAEVAKSGLAIGHADQEDAA